MRLTTINITSKNQESSSSKRFMQLQFKSKRTEIITWTVLFATGVTYFIAVLIFAIL